MAEHDDLVRRVERLIAAYIGCMDQDDLERWPTFFTEDGLYRITTRDNYERGMPASFFYCNGRGMLHDRVLALRRANIYEPHYYRHMVSGTRLVRRSGIEVRLNNGSFCVRRDLCLCRTRSSREWHCRSRVIWALAS